MCFAIFLTAEAHLKLCVGATCSYLILFKERATVALFCVCDKPGACSPLVEVITDNSNGACGVSTTGGSGSTLLNISTVKPTVAKLLLGLPKPGRSSAALQSALQRGQRPLNCCMQSRQPWQCPPPSRDTQNQSLCSGLCKFLLLGEEIWLANPSVHCRQPFPELLSTVHSLPHSLQGLHRGDTSLFLICVV